MLKIIKTKHFRIFLEMSWKDRPRPYWFYANYPDGMRRIGLPFLTIDVNYQ